MRVRCIGLLVVLAGCCLIWNCCHAQQLTPRERAVHKTWEAVQAFNRGDFDEAEDLLRDSLAIDDALPETHFWLALIYRKNATHEDSRSRAIAHLECTFELNPYGEFGRSARIRLYELKGRPKNMAIAVADVRDAKIAADSYTTGQVLKRLHGSGAEDCVITVSDQRIRPSQLTREYLEQLSQANNKHPAFGWLALVTAYDRETGRSDKGLPFVHGKARVWVADTLTGLVYEPVTITGTSLDLLQILGLIDELDRHDAWDLYLTDLTRGTREAVQSIGVDPYDVTLCDEMLIPTDKPGVYARTATCRFEEACQRPVVAVAVDRCDETAVGVSLWGSTTDGRPRKYDIAPKPFYDRVVEKVQRSLIDTKLCSVVSERTVCHVLGEDHGGEYALDQRECEVFGEQIGARFLAAIKFEPVHIAHTIHLFKEKARVQTKAHLRVTDLEIGQDTVNEEIAVNHETSAILYGNRDHLMKWAVEERSKLADDFANRLSEAIRGNLGDG